MRASNLEKWFDAIVAVFVVWVVMLGACTIQPEQQQTPASIFVTEYAKNMGTAFGLAADGVANEKIETDAKLLKMLQELTEAARAKAAKPVDEYLEKNLSNGKLSQADAEVLMDLSKQFEALSGR
jgi:hypothetical protein